MKSPYIANDLWNIRIPPTIYKISVYRQRSMKSPYTANDLLNLRIPPTIYEISVYRQRSMKYPYTANDLWNLRILPTIYEISVYCQRSMKSPYTANDLWNHRYTANGLWNLRKVQMVYKVNVHCKWSIKSAYTANDLHICTCCITLPLKRCSVIKAAVAADCFSYDVCFKRLKMSTITNNYSLSTVHVSHGKAYDMYVSCTFYVTLTFIHIRFVLKIMILILK